MPKRKVGPKLNPEGFCKILFLDQIVYPGSALFSKCFLVRSLIGSFNLCFHFSFLVPLIRTMNVYRKKVSVL